MESSGQAVFKTVPAFACRATFEGDIESFRPLKVLLATTVYEIKFDQNNVIDSTSVDLNRES